MSASLLAKYIKLKYNASEVYFLEDIDKIEILCKVKIKDTIYAFKIKDLTRKGVDKILKWIKK